MFFDYYMFYTGAVVPSKPNLIFILLLETLIDFYKLQEDDDSVIPPFLPLSSEHISDDGIYLLENGHDCLIYVGDSVNPDIVQKLFGVATVDKVPTLVISILSCLFCCHCLSNSTFSVKFYP